jgi:hypothetical protein
LPRSGMGTRSPTLRQLQRTLGRTAIAKMFPYLASEKPAEAAALLLLSSREKKFKCKLDTGIRSENFNSNLNFILNSLPGATSKRASERVTSDETHSLAISAGKKTAINVQRDSIQLRVNRLAELQCGDE